MYQFGEFRIEALARTLRRNEEIVTLNRRAFDVLLYFVQNPGRVLRTFPVSYLANDKNGIGCNATIGESLFRCAGVTKHLSDFLVPFSPEMGFS